MKIKDKHFKIEYYPLTNKYYPTYKKYYFYKDPCTGIIKLRDSMAWAQEFNNKKDATDCIKLYREQQLKENVVIIPFNSNCLDCENLK